MDSCHSIKSGVPKRRKDCAPKTTLNEMAFRKGIRGYENCMSDKPSKTKLKSQATYLGSQVGIFEAANQKMAKQKEIKYHRHNSNVLSDRQ
jgi:hypothetical protein